MIARYAGEPEQPRGVAAEDRDLFVVAQGRRREHVVNRVLFPGDRMIGAEHELARSDLRHQMTQTFRGEHHGVIVELLEILRWRFGELDRGVTVLR